MAHYRGPWANERGQTLPLDDCLAAGGVNLARAGGVPGPTDHAEVEALRRDSGDSVAGQGFDTLIPGLRKRYGVAVQHHVGSWSAIVNALAEGRVLVVRGNYWVLPQQWRYQLTAGFSHALFISQSATTATSAYEVDPLEVQIVHGRDIPLSVLKPFCASNGYDAISYPEHERPDTHTVRVKGWFMRYHPGRIPFRTPWFSRGATFRVGPVKTVKTIHLVQGMGDSAYRGWWVNKTGRNVTYR